MILSFIKGERTIYVNSKEVYAFEGLDKEVKTILWFKSGDRFVVDEPVNVVYTQFRKAKGWRK